MVGLPYTLHVLLLMPMNAHEIDFTIQGDDMQVVRVVLDPQEAVIAEAGVMNWMDANIGFESKLGDGSQPDSGFFGRLWEAGKRALSGESLFLTHFTNQGPNRQEVAFAAPYPGKIVPMNLAQLGGEIICQRDAFLCAAKGINITVAFTKKLGAGFFGGEGFILQRLRGDGLAFVHAGGTVVERELNGETLRVDTGCLMAFTSGLEYSIERAGNLKSMIFGGEGIFLATIRGHGRVWIQSLPFARLADRIIDVMPQPTGGERG